MATNLAPRQEQCITCKKRIRCDVDFKCEICNIAEHVACMAKNDNLHGWLESNANDLENDICWKCVQIHNVKK